MYQAAGHEWQQVEKHGMTSPVTLTAVWGRYLIQGLNDVLSIWLFSFPSPGFYSDKYLLLFPGLGGLYFRPLSVMSKYKFQEGWCDVDALNLYTLYEVTGSNLGWVTGYLDSSFLWFSSVLSGKFIGSISIWPR